MVSNVEQTSWHIEEFYHPHPARKIRSVVDILTDEHEMPLDVKETGFVGLKVVATNAYNTELACLNYSVDAGESFNIIVNLGQLDSFPPVPNSFKAKYSEGSARRGIKHVRLEIEYTIRPVELDRTGNRLINWFVPKKSGICEFSGEMQPEFSTTLPKGWVISGDSVFRWILDSSRIQRLRNYVRGSSVYRGVFGSVRPVGKHFEGRATGLLTHDSSKEIELEEAPELNDVEARKDLGVSKELQIIRPYIKTNDNGRYTYQYLIKADCYKKLRDWIKKSKEHNGSFSPETVLIFQSEPSRQVIAISLLQYAVFAFSFLIFSDAALSLWHHTSTSFSSGVAVAYLAGLLPLSYFYADLTITEKYDIPHRLLFACILIFSIGAIILNLIASLSFH